MKNKWILGGRDYRNQLYFQFRDNIERLRHKILLRKIDLLVNRLVNDTMKTIAFYESLLKSSWKDSEWNIEHWVQDGVEDYVQQFELDVQYIEDLEDCCKFEEFELKDNIIDELQKKMDELTTEFFNKDLKSWSGLGWHTKVHDDGFIYDDYYDDYDESVNGKIRLKRY